MRIETLFEGVGLFAGMDLALLIVKSKDRMIKELEVPFLDYVHENLADRKTMRLKLIQLGDEQRISFLLVNDNIVSPFSQEVVPILEVLVKSLENQPIVDGVYLLPEDHVAISIHSRLYEVFAAGQRGVHDIESCIFPAPVDEYQPFQLDATAEARQSRMDRYLDASGAGEKIIQSPEEEILRVADKVIMHTSPPHKLTVEALDAAEGLKSMDGHLFAYVTQDNRVISFSQPAKWVDGELGRDQKIVYAPAYDKLDTK